MRKAPKVEINKILLGDSTEVAELTARAYSQLSGLYESNQKIKLSEFLVGLGIIRARHWKSYPSGYRRIASRILNDVLVLQSIYGDRRDIHLTIEQTKVPGYWRSEQRHWLTRIIEKVRNVLPTRQRSRSDREQVSAHFRTLLKDELLSYSFSEVLEYFGR